MLKFALSSGEGTHSWYWRRWFNSVSAWYWFTHTRFFSASWNRENKSFCCCRKHRSCPCACQSHRPSTHGKRRLHHEHRRSICSAWCGVVWSYSIGWIQGRNETQCCCYFKKSVWNILLFYQVQFTWNSNQWFIGNDFKCEWFQSCSCGKSLMHRFLSGSVLSREHTT